METIVVDSNSGTENRLVWIVIRRFRVMRKGRACYIFEEPSHVLGIDICQQIANLLLFKGRRTIRSIGTLDDEGSPVHASPRQA